MHSVLAVLGAEVRLKAGRSKGTGRARLQQRVGAVLSVVCFLAHLPSSVTADLT
jgi:hypothetical protein